MTAYRKRELNQSKREVERIRGTRRQIVEDHLANPRAIPLDLLEEKQTKLGGELAAAEGRLARAEADVGRAEEGLRLARGRLQDSAGSYNAADPQTRRRWNQMFFRKLFIGPEGVSATELTDGFGELLREDLATKLTELEKQPAAGRDLHGGASNVEVFLDFTRVEYLGLLSGFGFNGRA